MPKILAVFSGIVLIYVSAMISLQFIGALGEVGEELRVQASSESKGCTVAVAPATTCTITLVASHAHGDTSHLTITETSPGSAVRTGSLDNPTRTVLTVSGLTAATTYIFSVDYEIENPDVSNELSLLARGWPLLAIVSVFIMAWVAYRRIAT